MDVVEKALAGGHWPGVTLVQVTLLAALGVLVWLAACRGGPALRGAVVLAAPAAPELVRVALRARIRSTQPRTRLRVATSPSNAPKGACWTTFHAAAT